jgi:hypothetical protein
VSSENDLAEFSEDFCPSSSGCTDTDAQHTQAKKRKPTILDYLKWRTSIHRPLVAYRAARVLRLFLQSSDRQVDWLLKHLEAARITQVTERGHLRLTEVV